MNGSVDVLNPNQVCKNCLRFKQFVKDFDERLELLTKINKEQRQKIELLENKLDNIERSKTGGDPVEKKF